VEWLVGSNRRGNLKADRLFHAIFLSDFENNEWLLAYKTEPQLFLKKTRSEAARTLKSWRRKEQQLSKKTGGNLEKPYE